MVVHAFTDPQVKKARHALGLDRQMTAYRNYWGGSDDADWNDMVERGFATKRESPVSAGFVYQLSKQSAFFFLDAGEALESDMKFPMGIIWELYT